MPIELNCKIEGMREFERDIEKLRTRALPFAAKDLINGAAVATEIHWKAGIATTFIHRDRSGWIERSLRTERAHGSDINQMVARVGALADRAPLLGIQESGGDIHGKSGHQPIPAPSAAMQAPGTQRSKRVVGSRMLQAIAVAKPVSGKSRQQQNAIALAQARRKGQRFAILVRPSGGKGLFLVAGPKKKLTGRLVWDLSKSSVHIGAHNILQRALEQTERVLPHIAEMAVQSQLARQHIGK